MSRVYSIMIAIVLSLFFFSCDTFKEDDLNLENTAEVKTNSIFLVPNSSSVVDLNNVVEARETVKVNITEQPTEGQFKNIKGNLYRYKPNKGFNGTDKVGFDVISENNELILNGSLEFTVTSDSSQFPCQIFAAPDFANVAVGEEATIDVLENDYLCASQNPVITIVEEPSNGRFEVDSENARIFYYPDSQTGTTDSLFYKVDDADQPTGGSIGAVHITVSTMSCTLTLGEDSVSIDYLSESFKIVDVLANDQTCNADSTANGFISIVDPAAFSEVSITDDNKLKVIPNGNMGAYTDVLAYQVCNGDYCEVARLEINVTKGDGDCVLSAVEESVEMNVDETKIVDVLANDETCDTDTSVAGYLTINDPAAFSDVSITDDNKLKVIPNGNMGAYNDVVAYQFCEGDSCAYGRLLITVKEP